MLENFKGITTTIQTNAKALSAISQNVAEASAHWVINNAWGVQYPAVEPVQVLPTVVEPSGCGILPEFFQGACQMVYGDPAIETVKSWWSENCPFWCPVEPEKVVESIVEAIPSSICDGLNAAYQGLEDYCYTALNYRDAFGLWNMALAQSMGISPESLALAEMAAAAVVTGGALYLSYKGVQRLCRGSSKSLTQQTEQQTQTVTITVEENGELPVPSTLETSAEEPKDLTLESTSRIVVEEVSTDEEDSAAEEERLFVSEVSTSLSFGSELERAVAARRNFLNMYCQENGIIWERVSQGQGSAEPHSALNSENRSQRASRMADLSRHGHRASQGF